MEVKKKDSANLSGKVSRNVLVGVNLALGITLLALNFWTKPLGDEPKEEEPTAVVVADNLIIDVPEDVAPPPPPPPDAPPPPPPPPEVITEIEETDEPPPPPPKEVTPPPPAPVPTNTRVVVPQAPKGPPPPPPPPPPKKEKRKEERLAARDVDQMAVYPGCERDRQVKKASSKAAKKTALIKCFSKQLGEDISSQLDQDDLSEYAQDNDKSMMATKLKFVVDKQGRLVEIKPVAGGDAYLKPEAVKAIQKVSERLQRKGGILPAKYNDGAPVEMTFAIPVKFRFEL